MFLEVKCTAERIVVGLGTVDALSAYVAMLVTEPSVVTSYRVISTVIRLACRHRAVALTAALEWTRLGRRRQGGKRKGHGRLSAPGRAGRRPGLR